MQVAVVRLASRRRRLCLTVSHRLTVYRRRVGMTKERLEIAPKKTRFMLDAELVRLETARAVLDAEQGVSAGGRRVVEMADASLQDAAEVGNQYADRDEVLTELRLLDADITAVRAAMERVVAGTYGTCIDCGERLSDERLSAVPTALRCVADQRTFEGGPSALTSTTSVAGHRNPDGANT